MVFARLGVRSWYKFCSLRRGYYWEVFLYLCRSTHSECGCKSFVNFKEYLSYDGYFRTLLQMHNIIWNNISRWLLYKGGIFSSFGIPQHFSNHLSQANARCVARNLTIHVFHQLITKLPFRASAEHLHLQNHSVLNQLQLLSFLVRPVVEAVLVVK